MTRAAPPSSAFRSRPKFGALSTRRSKQPPVGYEPASGWGKHPHAGAAQGRLEGMAGATADTTEEIPPCRTGASA